jgi:hypothetical protein
LNYDFKTLIEKKNLGNISWMKHRYKDRFFSDPFVLNVVKDDLVILAEEFIFSKNKGTIVKLIIDRYTKKLKYKIQLLELNTHLSYPLVFRLGNDIYICPENSQAGKLTLYLYDQYSEKLIPVKALINEPLLDATLFYYENKYWIIASKLNDLNNKLYVYYSSSIDGKYSLIKRPPDVFDRGCIRSAGNIIFYKNKLYRPAQVNINRYGEGIGINEIENMTEDSYKEKCVFKIFPNSFKYNLGLHTINFFEDICVVDGCGYLYPLIGRMMKLAKRLIKSSMLCNGGKNQL